MAAGRADCYKQDVRLFRAAASIVVALCVIVIAVAGCGSSAPTSATPAPSSGGGPTPPPSPPTPLPGHIAACGTYTGPGPFTVDGDVKAAGTGCVRFENTAGVTLDCQAHDLGAVTLFNVQNFTLTNCQVHLGITHTVEVLNSTGVTLDNLDVVGQVFVNSSNQTVLRNSRFRMPGSFVVPGGFVSCEVCLYTGQNNVLSGSTVDGGWDGNVTTTYGKQGVDDAVLLNAQTNIAIVGNVLTNAFDAGIEPATSDVPLTAIVRDNTITHVGYAGIGAYYIAGWQNSVFAGNTVTDSPSLIRFDVTEASSAHLSAVALVGNTFENNTFRSPVAMPLVYSRKIQTAMLIDFVSGAPPGPVSGNIIRGNDFGMGPGPVLAPANGFVDGGGNICSSSTVLSCGGSGVAAHLVPFFGPAQPLERVATLIEHVPVEIGR